jgi:hypothetical protein
MKNVYQVINVLVIALLPIQSFAFDSGSSGADGELMITQDTELQTPPSGIFNYTNITVAAGATLTFARNANNSPVTMLASGDVTIDGNIRVDGGAGGIANLVNPGLGGPGGFDGGEGGLFRSSGASMGGYGKGPGGGSPSTEVTFSCGGRGGEGGGYGTAGQNTSGSLAGNPYGNAELLPLIGGSGGGGGNGFSHLGTGGGGGGGALLIAATGTVTVTGEISADGGISGGYVDNGAWCGVSAPENNGTGGGGSGGAIRIVATTLAGAGPISAVGSVAATASSWGRGGTGGAGRIRLEAENFLRAGNTTPAYTFSTPNVVFISNLPAISIASVGGETVPAAPTGFRDVELPGITTNPVAVVFTTANVPIGTTITLSAVPVRGLAVTANSTPVAGSLAAGTAAAEIDLPNGNSTLLAQTTFTLTAALGMDFSRYAQGEQVKQVTVAMSSDGRSETTFITVSGKAFTWPSDTMAIN